MSDSAGRNGGLRHFARSITVRGQARRKIRRACPFLGVKLFQTVKIPREFCFSACKSMKERTVKAACRAPRDGLQDRYAEGAQPRKTDRVWIT